MIKIKAELNKVKGRLELLHYLKFKLVSSFLEFAVNLHPSQPELEFSDS